MLTRSSLRGGTPLACLILTAGLCLGDTGDLDLSFGSGGKVTAGFEGPVHNRGKAVVLPIGPGGRFVIVGEKSVIHGTSSGQFLGLVCYQDDGSVDTTFGIDGEVTTGLIAPVDGRTSATMDSQGRILVAGATPDASTNSHDFAVSRYDSQGELDTSFGAGGTVSTDIGGTYDHPVGIAVDSQERIVVAGRALSSTWNIAVVRYLQDGQLDSSFGSDGRATTSIGNSRPRAESFALDADDRIIVCGWVNSYNPVIRFSSNLAVVRFAANGVLEHVFESNFGGIDRATDLALDGQGRILLAGRVGTYTLDFTVARYSMDGTLDATFGVGGLAQVDFAGGNDFAYSIALDDLGRILVAGLARVNLEQFGVARLLANGAPDPNFGVAGRVSTDVAGWSDIAHDVAVDDQGRIVLVGTANTYSDPEPTGIDIGVVRYDDTGALDPTFGTGGIVLTDLEGGTNDTARDVVTVQADGKIVAVGHVRHAGGIDAGLARFNADGSPDTSFGDEGVARGGFRSFQAESVAIDAQGGIVVGGFTNSPWDFALARFLSDGSLDGNFGTGGLVTTDIAGGTDWGAAMVIDPSGRIVLAGWTNSGTPTYVDIALARYHPDGSLDASFGTGGVVVTDFGIANLNQAGEALAIDSQGRILVAGRSSWSENSTTLLVRYDENGLLDTTFGVGGLVMEPVGVSDLATGIAIDANDAIVVVGHTVLGTVTYDRDAYLLRYNEDGSPDVQFGAGGLVTTNFLGSSDAANDLHLDSTGAITVVGYAYNPPYGMDFAIARYNYDGSLAAYFGNGGIVYVDFDGDHDYGYGVTVDAKGRIVVAGQAHGFGRDVEFGLARLEGIESPLVLLEWLVESTQALVPGMLNNGQGGALLKHLSAAIEFVDSEDHASATARLQAYVAMVDGFLAGGMLSPAEAQLLVGAASQYIAEIDP